MLLLLRGFAVGIVHPPPIHVHKINRGFCFFAPRGKIRQAEVMGSRAAWALGEWPSLEVFVRGEHMQARRHVVAEGLGVESCLVLEAVVATQKGRLDEVHQLQRLCRVYV